MRISDTASRKRKETIAKRQQKQREILLDELRKNSVMTVACQKSGIPRSTVYRWMKDDPAFLLSVEEASSVGRETINDMAESVVIKKIREESLPAARYWLSHNNNRYRTIAGKMPLSDFARIQIEGVQDMWKFLFDKLRRKN